MDQVLSTATICICSTGLAAIVLGSVYVVSHVRSSEITLVCPDIPSPFNNGTTVIDLVNKYCKSLKEGFKPSWWLPTGHAQTIYSAAADFSKDDHVVYQRLPDGGTIGIDINPPLSIHLPSSVPVVIINHGLTGGSHENYVRNMVLWVTKPWDEGGLGGRAAVVNFRGCASTPITSPHLYCSGTTLDTHTATTYLSSLFPESPFLGIGFSLGAAVMTRYLGEQGDSCRLKAATVLCCPLELQEMSAKLDSRHFFPRLYSLAMARKMLRSLSPHLLQTSPLSSPNSHLHPHISTILDLPARYRWTLRASHVTELVIAKVGGSSPHFPFEGLQQFLEWACPSGWIGQIKRPTLAISALDDPIVSGECLPLSTVRASSHFLLATVPHGGHLGWFDGPMRGPDRHRRWHIRPVMEFLRGVLLDLRDTDHKVTFEMETTEDGWCDANGTMWKVLADEKEECA